MHRLLPKAAIKAIEAGDRPRLSYLFEHTLRRYIARRAVVGSRATYWKRLRLLRTYLLKHLKSISPAGSNPAMRPMWEWPSYVARHKRKFNKGYREMEEQTKEREKARQQREQAIREEGAQQVKDQFDSMWEDRLNR